MSAPGETTARLVVVPTPIGNLEDITLRALAVLRAADLIACEDTRHTRILLERHAIRGDLLSVHEHNERARADELAARIADGQTIALVTDAGTPAVSDPGYPLIASCIRRGLRVEVLPGASAVLPALVASGLPSQSWRFAGFLPRKAGELTRAFAVDETTVFFESPRRLAASLRVLSEVDPERPVAVCRELSKLYEEIRRGTARELADHYSEENPRGEIVLVIGAARAAEEDIGPALEALRALVQAGAKARPAAAVVSELTGFPANALYRGLHT